MKKIIEAHKFFCRKSQHYVMGDWNNYQDWFIFKDDKPFPDLVFNWRKFRYTYYFPIAYIKFMYLTLTNK